MLEEWFSVFICRFNSTPFCLIEDMIFFPSVRDLSLESCSSIAFFKSCCFYLKSSFSWIILKFWCFLGDCFTRNSAKESLFCGVTDLKRLISWYLVELYSLWKIGLELVRIMASFEDRDELFESKFLYFYCWLFFALRSEKLWTEDRTLLSRT